MLQKCKSPSGSQRAGQGKDETVKAVLVPGCPAVQVVGREKVAAGCYSKPCGGRCRSLRRCCRSSQSLQRGREAGVTFMACSEQTHVGCAVTSRLPRGRPACSMWAMHMHSTKPACGMSALESAIQRLERHSRGKQMQAGQGLGCPGAHLSVPHRRTAAMGKGQETGGGWWLGACINARNTSRTPSHHGMHDVPCSSCSGGGSSGGGK